MPSTFLPSNDNVATNSGLEPEDVNPINSNMTNAIADTRIYIHTIYYIYKTEHKYVRTTKHKYNTIAECNKQNL